MSMSAANGTQWIEDVVALLSLVIAVNAAWRITSRTSTRRTDLDIDVAHGLMGVAMASMLWPPTNVIAPAMGEAVFSAVALWFVIQTLRVARRPRVERHVLHYPIHVVMAVSMTDMYALGTSSRPMTSMSQGHAPPPSISLVLLVALVVSAVATLDRLDLGRTPRGAATENGERWSHVGMCVAMAYMLTLTL
jgi:hypothetical protein